MAVQTKAYSFFNNFRSILTNRISLSVQPTLGISTETKSKLNTLPEKPKKPQTTFIRFCQEHRAEVVKSNPSVKLGEITKILAEKWKTVNEDVKKAYEEKYKKEMVKYTKEHLDYLASLTDQQKQILSDYAKEKKHIKETKKLHQFYKDSNKPKRPKGPYMWYVTEKSSIDKQPLRTLLSECKGKWMNMSESEKLKYTQMYEDDKKRYETEMEAWEGKMIEEGHLNVIRKSTLEDHKPKSKPKRNVEKKPKEKVSQK
ncbi:transcription factor A, mitochondrial-like [Onthophagus taurus]|uniref:transcription factor A, mitochondrial-like n=1 Tax=Onthophagus taurus TaxID=166361 RepID=UPI000C2086C9|nr:high mobility group B protein 13-like [Onthophagus taurus]